MPTPSSVKINDETLVDVRHVKILTSKPEGGDLFQSLTDPVEIVLERDASRAPSGLLIERAATHLDTSKALFKLELDIPVAQRDADGPLPPTLNFVGNNAFIESYELVQEASPDRQPTSRPAVERVRIFTRDARFTVAGTSKYFTRIEN